MAKKAAKKAAKRETAEEKKARLAKEAEELMDLGEVDITQSFEENLNLGGLRGVEPNEESNNTDMLYYADVGAGKSRLFGVLAHLKRKQLILHSGSGNHGLESARRYLRSIHGPKGGDEYYEKYIRIVEAPNFPAIKTLLEMEEDTFWKTIPQLFGSTKDEWFADVEFLNWEEFNGVQSAYAQYYLKGDFTADRGDKKESWQFWSAMAFATTAVNSYYLHMQHPQRRLTHITTAHDTSRAIEVDSEVSSESVTPLIQGKSIKQVLASYGLIIRGRKKVDPMDPSRILYVLETCPDPAVSAGKTRLEGFPAELPADWERLWPIFEEGKDEPDFSLLRLQKARVLDPIISE